MSGTKILIRKVNTFLSPSLTYHKEESKHFIRVHFHQAFHKQTCLIWEQRGVRPHPRHQEAPGGLGKAGVPRVASRPPSVLSEARPLLRLRQKREQDFPGNRITRGRTAELLSAFSPSPAKSRSDRSGDNERLWEETSVRLRAGASGDPRHWGPDRLGAEGPSGGRPRTAAAAPKDRAGRRELCSWEGRREGAGSGELRASHVHGRA